MHTRKYNLDLILCIASQICKMYCELMHELFRKHIENYGEAVHAHKKGIFILVPNLMR